MKKTIVISINPEHVKNIINGSKKFEYRKRAARHDIDKIIIYETLPIKKIVAEVEIIEVLMMEPKSLWKMTKQFSGISKSFFDSYFENQKIAYAYRLGKVLVYKQPKELQEFGINSAPQSFVYVNC